MPRLAREFTFGWSALIASIRNLWDSERTLLLRPELSHYEELSRQTLSEMEDVGFVAAVQEAWLKKKETIRETIAADLFLLEIESFTNSVAEIGPQPPDTLPDTRGHLLKNIATIFDSIKKIFGDILPSWVKAIIDVAIEVAKFFER